MVSIMPPTTTTTTRFACQILIQITCIESNTNGSMLNYTSVHNHTVNTEQIFWESSELWIDSYKSWMQPFICNSTTEVAFGECFIQIDIWCLVFCCWSIILKYLKENSVIFLRSVRTHSSILVYIKRYLKPSRASLLKYPKIYKEKLVIYKKVHTSYKSSWMMITVLYE